jgi:hypothetical protein
MVLRTRALAAYLGEADSSSVRRINPSVSRLAQGPTTALALREHARIQRH